MKRIIVCGIYFIGGLFLISGCSTSNSSETTASLEKEISKLKTENSDLKKKITAYEGLLGIDESEGQSNDSSEAKSSSNSKMYKNGETLLVGDGEKTTAEIKITEATTAQTAFPEHMVNLDTYDTSKMVAVTIEYKNVDMDEAFLPHASYFQAFDSNGSSLEQVNQQSGQDEVAVGRTGKTTLYWELSEAPEQFNQMEIDFIPNSEKIATFDISVSH